MRPWIRWSSLALALCNTGCGEQAITYGCDADLELSLPANGALVNLSDLIERKCRWQFVDENGTALASGGGSIRFTDQPSLEPFATLSDADAAAATAAIFRAGANGIEIADGGTPVGTRRALRIEITVPAGRKVYLSQQLSGGPVDGGQVVPYTKMTNNLPVPAVTTLSGAPLVDTVTVWLRTVAEDALGSYTVGPDKVDLSTMSPPTVRMSATLPAAGQQVVWDVISPTGVSASVPAAPVTPLQSVADYLVAQPGTYVFRARVDGIVTAVKTVQVVRDSSLSFNGQPRFVPYSQSNDTRVVLEFPLTNREKTDSKTIHFVKANWFDTHSILPAGAFGGVDASDVCALARAANSPQYRAEHSIVSWQPRYTMVSTQQGAAVDLSAFNPAFTATDAFFILSQDLSERPTVSTSGAVDNVVWSNMTDRRGTGPYALADGLYCIDACIASGENLRGRLSEADLVAACSDSRRHCFGVSGKKPCDGAGL